MTIEIVPYGIEAESRILDLIRIHNEGTGTAEIGNYGVQILRERGKSVFLKIKNFKRKEPNGELRLLKEVLDACLR